ncbi:hypothetical protein CASFOL_038552 [Castilleja foliolosa]|uniref:Uncharacterized protein n=1 Tax=Castilleja foliolosa TaxID=1961234 RepID=A0ABD3BLA8_9LAMI
MALRMITNTEPKSVGPSWTGMVVATLLPSFLPLPILRKSTFWCMLLFRKSSLIHQ